MLAILAQLFLVCFLLIVNGEPLRFFVLRRLKLFMNLDLVQICILDVYLGGFILYVIAMLPFKLFNWVFIIGFSLICIILSFAVHFGALKDTVNMLKTKTCFTRNNLKVFSTYILIFIMFAIFLLINLLSVSSLIFGSVRDESIHSLHVQVILENSYVPLTLQPYLPEGIIYPQASHVIFAFASHFLDMDIPNVVLYITVFFKSLSVVAAYFLGLRIGFNRTYSVGLSFVFAFISSWPLFITWGGNPFTVGFPLFLVCLGLLFSLFCSGEKNSYTELLIAGLLFGYLGAIVISYLQTLMTTAFLILIYYSVRKFRISHLFLDFLIVFGISLLPLSPFLSRFFAFYQYPGHNIGLPSDFTQWKPQQFYITQALQWAFDNLSPYLLLRVMIVFMLAIYTVLIWKTKNYENMKPTIAFGSTIFVSATLLSFISFFLPADFGVVSWGHQGIILSIFVNIVIAAFYIKFRKSCNEWTKKYLPKVFSKSFGTTTISTIAILSLVSTPFIYYRLSVDPSALRGAYSVYAVTTMDDYNLMLWMRENLSASAVVLVHPFEAGLFIPSISHHKVVYPYSGSTLSRSYQALVRLVENATLNLKAYELIQHLKVSHVFVGADVAYCEGYSKWVPELFLGNPNFKLVKNFGGAYLFEFKEYDPSIVFLDDFEYQSWQQNRWLNNYFGNGLGNVTIMAGLGENESKCLMIAAQAVPIVWDWDLKYAYCVSREIFVLNNSEVTLSFYLNTSQRFSENDTFAVFVSNIYRSQSLIVATTPNGIYKDYVGAILLNQSEGFFEFKGNESLSALWRKKFNSSLPTRFILEFVNWDLDGIKNVVYLDNIQVTSTVISESPEEAGFD